MKSFIKLCLGAVTLAASFACEGSLGSQTEVDGDRSASDDQVLGGACELGEQPLRRLSSLQYENTLRALFGSELGARVVEGSMFPHTVIDQGFRGDAEANTVNTAESNAIEDNAERVASMIASDPGPFLDELLPCDVPDAPAVEEIADCLDAFLDEFGVRAYRRPLTNEEAEIITNLYDRVSAAQGAITGFAAVMQLLVQSPALLYRVERGDEKTDEGHVRLSSYEMASRLSYFLTDSMPDDELLRAASADELRLPEEVRAQAERLLQTPEFSTTLARLIEDWLHLYELENAPKDPEVFPAFTNTVRRALEQEAGRLLSHVLSQEDGSLQTLLETAVLPVSADTAPLYGIEVADDFEMVEVPGRRGVLSLASVMAVHAEADRTSPIHRGVVFVRDVLCTPLPALPGDVDTATALEDTSGLPTARERLAPLLEAPDCRNCHQAFNPIGLAFENYDATGAWRNAENSETIDASGTFRLDGEDIAFAGPEELLAHVAESDRVRDCFSLQSFRAMKGGKDVAEDACSIESTQRIARESGGDLREIILSLVQTPAFLYRTGVSP